MKKMKKIIAFATALTLALTPTSTFANQRFSDVPATHWGHASIISISDRGYMVGNIAGEFRPDGPLDKFETARILANAAGFRQVGATAQQEAFMNTAYANHSATLQALGNTFTRWNPTTNREVAFLLERGILTTDDLNNFIVINNNVEQLRALSRQEAAVFLVRLIGAEGAAASGLFAQLFNDDASIAPNRRHYVYFLRNHGVVAGDPLNNFTPNAPVTRAAFAVMLDRTLVLGNTLGNVQLAGTSLTGTVSIVYPTIHAIQVQTSAGRNTIHRIADNAPITINGAPGTIAGLVRDMGVIATLENGVIVALNAGTGVTAPTTAPPTTVPPTAAPTTAPTGTTAAPTTPPAGTTVAPTTAPAGTTSTPTTAPSGTTAPEFNFFGTVNRVNTVARTIHVDIRFLTPSDMVVTQTMPFTLAQNFDIRRGGVDIALESIVIGEMVEIRANGTVAREIVVTERYRQFDGILLEKIDSGDNYIFIIRDDDGETHDFIVDGTTRLEREGLGVVSVGQVRIGDAVEIVVNQATLTSLFAFGTRSTVDGVITELQLRQGMSTLALTNNNGTFRYYLPPDLPNMDRLQIGERVRLRLDSREIEAFSILN